MNILSLFDGISCGRVALERAGLPVTSYYASEIDKHAITISKANWPDTIHLGNVENWLQWIQQLPKIDLVLAGSPCQGFSFAGKQLAFDDPRSKLFFTFVDILQALIWRNPDTKFLLENVPMKKEYEQVITRTLGVEPVLINSALASAQNRKRLYWCNWPVAQPTDQGIMLKDILDEQGGGWIKNLGEYHQRNDKAMCLDANYHKGADNHGQRTLIQVGTTNGKNSQSNRIYSTAGKSPTLRSHESGGSDSVKIAEGAVYRKLTPIECERLQTLPDNYTAHVSNTQRYKAIGNGWTVDVVAHILRHGGFQ